ncbi:hypothetical protein BD626DRAFT_508230 [Schizophyllum amplum]|uniref:DUF974-domain-containing protein n=1 Tax=Schizophyllum amplum TaxID=97359 RepID=A0A550C3Q9_9AGAR|nr:hypothetical protein BD626DRAFT_508230 [Auriculariopsis ampla]
MLPASFGSIQLGETFSSCLCANNDTQVDVDSVTVRVEMQTATTKVVLGEFGGPQYTLAAGDTLECIVNHEVKELGQHVLSCIVTYRLPPNARPPQPSDDPDDPQMQNFRKFYKFVVTNPLSVKTKVHTPKSPSAQLSPTERDKIFLERMSLEPVDGWDVEDPQDMRQYIYIMNPKSPPKIPVVHSPGSIIPLGRLDIAWRSSFGEPGRLLTSMLSRRIPLPPAPPPPVAPPVSAVPPYLKRGATSSTPSRPSSPGPPSRPGSPAPRVRTGSIVSPRPQTPPLLPMPLAARLPQPISTPALYRAHARPTRACNVRCCAVVSTRARGRTAPAAAHKAPLPPRIASSGSHATTATAAQGFNYELARQKLLLASPAGSTRTLGEHPEGVSLPAPYAAEATRHESAVLACGPSALSYVPVRRGFSTVGGLRLLVVEDGIMSNDTVDDDDIAGNALETAKVVKEWDVIAEIWV